MWAEGTLNPFLVHLSQETKFTSITLLHTFIIGAANKLSAKRDLFLKILKTTILFSDDETQ